MESNITIFQRPRTEFCCSFISGRCLLQHAGRLVFILFLHVIRKDPSVCCLPRKEWNHCGGVQACWFNIVLLVGSFFSFFLPWRGGGEIFTGLCPRKYFVKLHNFSLQAIAHRLIFISVGTVATPVKGLIHIIMQINTRSPEVIMLRLCDYCGGAVDSVISVLHICIGLENVAGVGKG